MSRPVVFSAKKIVTMDPNRPQATHVAIRDGYILAVGDAKCADAWNRDGEEPIHDSGLDEFVLMPGLVEGHAHAIAGGIWNYPYAGYHDRIDPTGGSWRGKGDLASVIADLQAIEKNLPPDKPLVGWGFDPIFLREERLCRRHLDRIGSDRPVAVMFSNFHLMCVNSKALEMVGYDNEIEAEGVVKDAHGEPTGELQEMAAMFPVMRRLGIDFRGLSLTEPAMRTYGEVCKRAGVTTATDLFSTMTEADADRLLDLTADERFPARIVPALGAMGATPAEIAERAIALRERSSDKLRMGAVKLMTDGSIQGWTARVKWPHYVGGHANGLWNTPPQLIFELASQMQRSGLQMHIHVNGDEASEVAIDALEAAAREHPWPDARHVLQHCQMMGTDQFVRCAASGIHVNLFSNHLWYFGDQHAALTIGEDRARRMNAARAALDAGVEIAIHSDAPITPMAPLFTAWCAVNRRTMSGRVLGEAQRISVDEALHAITLGAARTLKLDREIGSIETGKRADFAILGADPTACDAADLKDVPVLGTVLGGKVQLA